MLDNDENARLAQLRRKADGGAIIKGKDSIRLDRLEKKAEQPGVAMARRPIVGEDGSGGRAVWHPGRSTIRHMPHISLRGASAGGR